MKKLSPRSAQHALAAAVAALLGALFASTAHAGFLDERPVGAPEAAASAAAPAPQKAAAPAAPVVQTAPSVAAKPSAPPAVAAAATVAAAAAPAAARPAQAAVALPASSFTGVGWADPAPTVAGDGGIALSSAIAVLAPNALGAVSIEGDGQALQRRVSWPAGLSRGQAMDHVARSADVSLDLRGNLMRVASKGAVATMAAAPAPVSAVVTAPAPAPAVTIAATGAPAAAVVTPPAPARDAAIKIVEPTLKAEYVVMPSDINFRRVLIRWAATAGWTFDSTHWAMPRDIPVAAGANLGVDFKKAVQTLLESSTLTTMPARPCFYSNAVLRVVPRQEQCDRSGLPVSAQAN